MPKINKNKRNSFPKLNGVSENEQEICDATTVFIEEPFDRINRGNLTKNPRILRDAIIDMYNTVQEFNTGMTDGCFHIKEISHLIQHRLDVGEIIICEDEVLQINSDSLRKIWHKMEGSVQRMADIVKKLEALANLNSFQNKGIDCPLFYTWPCHRFVEECKKVCACYKKELALKDDILKFISVCRDSKALCFYRSSWAMQPYIEESLDVVLQIMLEEVAAIQPTTSIELMDATKKPATAFNLTDKIKNSNTLKSSKSPKP